MTQCFFLDRDDRFNWWKMAVERSLGWKLETPIPTSKFMHAFSVFFFFFFFFPSFSSIHHSAQLLKNKEFWS